VSNESRERNEESFAEFGAGVMVFLAGAGICLGLFILWAWL